MFVYNSLGIYYVNNPDNNNQYYVPVKGESSIINDEYELYPFSDILSNCFDAVYKFFCNTMYCTS